MPEHFLRKSRFAVALFFLSLFHAFSQNEVDSLRTVLQNAKGEARVDLLNELASYLLTINPVESEELAEEALSLSQESDYNRGFIRSWTVKSTLAGQQARYEEAAALLQQAKQLSDKELPAEGVSILMAMGTLSFRTGEYAKALEHHFEGVSVARQIGNTNLEVSHLLNIGYVKEVLGELDDAEKYLRQGLELCESNNFDFRAGQIYINLAVLEYKKQNLGLSIEYNKKALAIFEKAGDKSQAAICLQNLGFAYAVQGQVEEALSYYGRSEQLRREVGDQAGVGKVLLKKAQLVKSLWTTSRVLKLTDESLGIAESVGHSLLKRDIYAFLHTYFQERGNTVKALAYFKSLTQVKDSISAKASQARIAELTANFEWEQLRNQNRLQEQENQIKDLKIRKSYQLIAGLSVGMVLLILLILSQRRQMKNKLTLSQKDQLILKKETEALGNKLETEREKLNQYARELLDKNQVLEELREQLETRSPEGGTIDQLLEKLNASITTDKDWTAFKLYFEAAYPDFFSKLEKLSPETTYNDQRLVALMKINLSNKEIARILNISRDSVVRAKYRLRQKLDFKTTQQMEEALFKL
ncbi:MAG: tetratricopeptide repeat protein [Roseivirga sp.]|nr:tetratricopeptide repeat protein [Roseivirga sp.]